MGCEGCWVGECLTIGKVDCGVGVAGVWVMTRCWAFRQCEVCLGLREVERWCWNA